MSGDLQSDNRMAYFMPGELVLLVRHGAGLLDMTPESFEEALVAYLSDVGGLYEGIDGQVIEALHDPDRRRFSTLRTGDRALTSLSLDTGLKPNRLAAAVRELSERSSNDEPPTGDEFELRGATFNWLSSTSQGSTHTVGGPGARPVYISRQDAEAAQQTELDEFASYMESLPGFCYPEGDPQVDIAILDTAPPLPMLLAQLQRFVMNAADKHPLYGLLGDDPAFHFALQPRGDYLTVRGNNPPNPNVQFQISYNLMRHFRGRLLMEVLTHGEISVDLIDHPYMMTDHGLFIAGQISSLINRVAPDMRVRIHLIQTLNDYGVGTLDSLLHGLNWAVSSRENQDGRINPLVINCSLTMVAPRKGHDLDMAVLRRVQDGQLSNQAEDYYTRLGQDDAHARRMLQAIQDAIIQLGQQGINVVAAAGNESKGPSLRKPARFPAAFTEVLGVGALDANGIAVYSNEPDAPPWVGARSFGGGIETTPAPDEIDVSTTGVTGWYIGDFPQTRRSVTPPANTSGWARWSGTSFAAPRITAALAVLRACEASAKDASDAIPPPQHQPQQS